MAGLLPFLVAGDGAVCWRVDPPLSASETAEAIQLTEPAPTQSDSTATLARLLGELRELRAEVERNRVAVERAQAPAAPSTDPQQRVEELARRAMHEQGLGVGEAYRLVAREHPDAWAAAREAATLTDDLRGPTLEVSE
jgi:hypothetical protein